MSFALTAWLALSIVSGLVALFAVWSRRDTKYRFLSIIAFLMATLVSGALIVVSMGWASPCKFNLAGDYEIIGYTAVPEKIIFLFIQTEYGPKVCSIPWSTEAAEQLEQGKEENGGGGSKLKTKSMGGAIFSGNGGEPNIWNPPPQPKPSPKERPLGPLVEGVE